LKKKFPGRKILKNSVKKVEKKFKKNSRRLKILKNSEKKIKNFSKKKYFLKKK
jgi:hypothetical protein